MINWRKWIPLGLATTVALTLAAVLLQGPGVEGDLTTRTQHELDGQYSWAKVQLDGRDLTLEGEAPDAAARDEAIALAKKVRGVRVVADKAGLLAGQSPYTFSAEKADGRIVLNGFAASQQEKQSIVESAKAAFGGMEVVDDLKLASGAPEGFQDATAYAIGQLGRFSKGKASLSDLDLSVEGMANSTEDYDAALKELSGDLPNGLKLASRNISPVGISPYEWAADYDGKNLSLSGYVPSEKVREEIINSAKEKFPNAKIDDQMKIADGAGEAYQPTTEFVIARLAEMENGKASLSDSKLNIMGKASSLANYDTATMALKDSLPGGISLGDSKIDPANVEGAYSLTATKSEGKIDLKGFVPDADTAKAIEMAAKQAAGDGEVNASFETAAGVPEGVDWAKAGSTAVASLAGLVNGEAMINDDQLSVTGMASNLDTFDETRKMLGGELAGGLKLKVDGVKPPMADPFMWKVVGNSDGVAITGNVPDAKTSEANVMAAKKLFDGKSVNSDLKLASGMPAGFEDAVTLAMQATSRLKDAEGVVSGTKLMVKGEADSQEAMKAIESELNSNLPNGFILETAITAPAPPPVVAVPEKKVDCKQIFTDALTRDKINFESAKAVILGDSHGVLNDLVEAAKTCADTRIEIAGYTDATGSEESNLKLSQSRAEAVKKYLEDNGIASDRLSAKGYGPANPIGDNKTEEGKAKNRRIEFRVLK